MTLNRSVKVTLISFLVFCCVILTLAATTLGAYAQFLKQYEYRFYPGVHVAGVSLSGMTYPEAIEALEKKAELLETDGISIQYDENEDRTAESELKLTAIVVPLEAGGTTQELYALNIEESLAEAYQVGREGDRKAQMHAQFQVWQQGYAVAPLFSFDYEAIEALIEEQFAAFETPAKNADIVVKNPTEPIEIAAEKDGKTFNTKEIMTQVKLQLQSLDTTPIVIELETKKPKITTATIKKELPTIEKMIKLAPLALTWEGKRWEYDQATVANWLSYETGALTVTPSKLEPSLADIQTAVFIQGQEARWLVEKNAEGGLQNVVEIQPAKAGRTIDLKKTAQAITDWLNVYAAPKTDTPAAEPIAVAVKEAEPLFNADNIGKEGVPDLLGVGHTSLKGSSYNRRKNIERGMALLNGLMLAPGETFSTLKALKPFTLENGYVAELVIKGNRTTPEIGGGLCQIGTTLFRAAMDSGLDITERRNHSFAVPYYFDERNGLPGTDATIYDPAPDLKFKNDMEGHVLVQTRIVGDDVYVELWGKKDGRDGSFTPPRTYNHIAAPATKEIPTTELAPGQRKCSELPHTGMTSEFTYSITYRDGKKHEEVFTSVYRPWQAVCLVGTAPTVTPAPTTPTPPATNSNTNTSKSNTNKNKNSNTNKATVN